MDTGSRGIRMIVGSPEQAVEMVDRAFNNGDLEAVLSFYEDGAVVVTEPAGKLARGKEELRHFLEQALAAKRSARQMKTYVVEADGIALFLSRWMLTDANSTDLSASRRFIATTVFRKQPDGD